MTSGITSLPAEPVRPAFLSEADCRDLLKRLVRVTQGGGATTVIIHSSWTGNVRWARNQISTSGDVRNDLVRVIRNVNGASTGMNGAVMLNDFSDAALEAAARRAERLAQLQAERPYSDLAARFEPEALERGLPDLFSEATYQLDEAQRAAAAAQLATSAEEAGMHSAGYIEVSAHSMALLDTYGRVWYYPYTQAQYSVTVRDPKGIGSGWAGLDHYDWHKIDAQVLSQRALEKCLASRNSVKIEPGRYTVVLEPQAVCDFIAPLFSRGVINRPINEINHGMPFFKRDGDPKTGTPSMTKLSDQIIDARLTVSVDPRDPELGVPPFDNGIESGGLLPFLQDVYHPATWVKDGVLTALDHNRSYAASWLGQDTGLPNPHGFRMSVNGPTTSVEAMVTSTKRGLLVTRFDQVTPQALDTTSQLYGGHTRDGLWLIEDGKISKPVNNLVFTESIFFALNNVEAIGVPQRVFNPPVAALFPQLPQPVIVPALKIKDFSFTALDDAV